MNLPCPCSVFSSFHCSSAKPSPKNFTEKRHQALNKIWNQKMKSSIVFVRRDQAIRLMLHVHPFLLKNGHFAISFLVPHLRLSPAQQQYEGKRHLQSLASGLRHWKANLTLQSRVVPSVQLGLPKVSAAAVASVFDALAAPSNSTVKTFARSPYSTMRPWLQVRVKHLESSEIQAVCMSWNNWRLKFRITLPILVRRQTQKKARKEIAGDTAT